MAKNQALIDRLTNIAERYYVREELENYLQNYDVMSTEGDNYYDGATSTIYLNGDVSDYHLIQTFIHEAGHVDQDFSNFLALDVAFNSGDFWAYANERIYNEAMADAKTILALPDFSEWHDKGYINGQQAESAYVKAMLEAPEGATRYDLQKAVADNIYQMHQTEKTEKGYGRITTDAANAWMRYYRDGFSNRPDHKNRTDDPDAEVVGEAESIAEQFASYGDYDTVYIFENENGGYDVYAELDGEPAWTIRVGGNPGDDTDEEQGNRMAPAGRLNVTEMSILEELSMSAGTEIEHPPQETLGVPVNSLIAAMAQFNAGQSASFAFANPVNSPTSPTIAAHG